MPIRPPPRPLNLSNLSSTASSRFIGSSLPSPRHRTPLCSPGLGPKSPSAFTLIPIPYSVPATPFTPGFPRAADGGIHLGYILVLLNIASIGYTCLVARAATDRRSNLYDFIHKSDATWEGMWWSCKTFAALVSLTNTVLLFAAIGKVTRNGFWSVFGVSGKNIVVRIALIILVGFSMVLVGLIGIIPWRMTWGGVTSRTEEHWVFEWDK